MLYIIGIGLNPKQLTIEAKETLAECDKIYIEAYTSQYAQGTKDDLEDIIEKGITELGRKQVEEEFGLVLDECHLKKIALCVYGNPMNATTHLQIILDAQKKGIKTKMLAGISIFEMVAFTGLERYKFGKTTSIVFHEGGYEPESFYEVITENKKIGLHTLCLLDIKQDEKRMMSVQHAISLLETIELKREKNMLGESIIIGLAGIGSKKQTIKAGTMEQVKNFEFKAFPQSLIVCGKLNEKEIEGIKAMSDLDE